MTSQKKPESCVSVFLNGNKFDAVSERLIRKQIHDEVERAFRVFHNERCRQWRLNNPEAYAASVARSLERNAASIKLSQRMWLVFNRDKARAANRAWIAKNPDYHKKRQQKLVALGYFRKGGKYAPKRAA